MSKIPRLFRAPVRVVEDRKDAWVHRMGMRAARGLGQGQNLNVFCDPWTAVAESEQPIAGSLVRMLKEQAQERRTQLIRRACFPMVSVIVAVRDAGATLEAALESLLAQTYENLEIVVVDDGSTDSTAQILQQFAGANSRVRALNCPKPSGAALARNRGMMEATGAFLTFQDADDVSLPQRIEMQLARLLQQPSKPAYCVCDYVRVDGAGRPLKINGQVIRRAGISMMFRRSPILERLGYLRDLHVSEDSEYRERFKCVFGRRAELHVARILYLAGFNEGSLLFADGCTSVDAQQPTVIHHVRSGKSEHDLQCIRAWHRSIRWRGVSAYVGADGRQA